MSRRRGRRATTASAAIILLLSGCGANEANESSSSATHSPEPNYCFSLRMIRDQNIRTTVAEWWYLGGSASDWLRELSLDLEESKDYGAAGVAPAEVEALEAAITEAEPILDSGGYRLLGPPVSERQAADQMVDDPPRAEWARDMTGAAQRVDEARRALVQALRESCDI